jgi:lipopolysaccharide heptosyltransferase II
MQHGILTDVMNPSPLVPRARDHLLSSLLTALERAVDLVQRPPLLPAAPRRIVVLKSCCLGDALLATPMLGALRRAYPTAYIVAAVGRWARPALTGNPGLDSLLDLESVGVGHLSPASYLRALRRLRAGRFDLALVLDRTPVLTALPLLAGIPVRAGIDSAGRGFPLNVRVPWLEVEHEAHLFLRIATALGLETEGAALRFVPSPADHRAAAALWREAGLEGRRAVAMAPGGGANPGTTMLGKRWPAARFAALADALQGEHGLAVLLTGASDDRAVVEEVARQMRTPAVDLAGRTAFGALGAVLARCDLFAGNDSGPMHLAAAVGIPVLAIFGPTDPAVYAPFTRQAIVLRGPQGRDTAEVSVDEAKEAAGRLLRRHDGR